MIKNWKIKEIADQEKVHHLMDVLHIDQPIANLLVQRGISNYEEAKIFFRPDILNLIDPFLMKDMDAAIERFELAISRKEKILIYGDYDVDGTTAVSIIYLFFRNVVFKNTTDSLFHYYIPDRYTEGYGISVKGIDYASENGYSLIIALDCGIKSVDKVAYAKTKNIDFIICDHHMPGDILPNASAVLDPKRKDCTYPYKELSGCGIGFKFLQAYVLKNSLNTEELFTLLDLVAVSICSDIVPITGENRVLCYFGLKKINSNPSIGLKTIIRLAGIEKKNITVNEIVFKIGPRINAAGRIETGKSSVDLLISDNDEFSETLGSKLNVLNTERRDLDKITTEEALAMILSDEKMMHRKSTVLYNENWIKGVVGIVASRVIENYYKPTIILTRSNGIASGSARSIEGFDLYKAIEECGFLLENFGGHKHAAGLSLKIENIKAFQEKFDEVVSAIVTDEMLIPQIEIDAELNLKDINSKLVRILQQFQPYGPENMTPVFCTFGVRSANSAKLVGQDKEHIKLTISDFYDSSICFSAIAFSQAKYFDRIKNGEVFDICYTIEENEFMGNVNLQLVIRDIRFLEN